MYFIFRFVFKCLLGAIHYLHMAKNYHLLVRITHKILKASVTEQQLQQWVCKLAPKLNSEGISSWDQLAELARSNGFETIYNSCWVKHPLEIENQKLLSEIKKFVKELRPCITKRSVQRVVPKHQLNSTRVTALVGKEPCFTAKSWSLFSARKRCCYTLNQRSLVYRRTC